MSTPQGRAKDKGKAFERKLTTELNVAGLPSRRVGQFGGKTDVLVDGLSAIQAKKFALSRFPGWMVRELADLEYEQPELEPALVIESAPGRGARSERVVVITWDAYMGMLWLISQGRKGS